MNLTQTALLVSLSISKWNPTRTDSKSAQDILDAHKSENFGDRYIKNLVPQAALQSVINAEFNYRRAHLRLTLPWLDNGARILPAKGFFEYQEVMNEKRAAFDEAVEEMVANYPKWVEHARQTRGDLFREEDYPTAEEVREKFKVTHITLPFPEVNDFRLQELDGEQLATMKADLADSLARVNQSNVELLTQNILLILEKMASGQTNSALFRSLRMALDKAATMNYTDNFKLTRLVNMTGHALQTHGATAEFSAPAQNILKEFS